MNRRGYIPSISHNLINAAGLTLENCLGKSRLSEKVKAIIVNQDHRYDDFISKLQTITENEKDVSTKQDPEEGPIIKKRIKPLS